MNVDFSKHPDGLVPAIIQDASTKKVLMLGYMNALAMQVTEQTKKVTFYSRSKNRLWTKGEESGHFLTLVSIKVDCDKDSLLILAKPMGPTCHTGTDTCWKEENKASYGFLSALEQTISNRVETAAVNTSYVAQLFEKGINKIAQKVGEEAVEVVIEAMGHNDALFLEESSDLLFHYLLLLKAKGFSLHDIAQHLEKRQQPK